MSDREGLVSAVSKVLGDRAVRWSDAAIGDFDGSERTLEVFEADAADQRRLLRALRPLRQRLSDAAGGPVVVVFHTCAESARLHAEFLDAWRRRRAVAARVAEWLASPDAAEPSVGPEDIEPLTLRDAA